MSKKKKPKDLKETMKSLEPRFGSIRVVLLKHNIKGYALRHLNNIEEALLALIPPERESACPSGHSNIEYSKTGALVTCLECKKSWPVYNPGRKKA